MNHHPVPASDLPIDQAYGAVRTLAREIAQLTDAEFEYSLAGHSDRRALQALSAAIYVVANRHLPDVEPGDDPATLTERRSNADQLTDRCADLIDRDRLAAREQNFTGWSDASQQRGLASIDFDH